MDTPQRMSVDLPVESLNHLHAMSSSNNLEGMHTSAGLVGTVTHRGASQGVSQEEAEELLAFLEEQENEQPSLSSAERRAFFALRRIAGRLLNADVSRTSVDESDTYESVGVLLALFRCAREAQAQATPKASLLDSPTVRPNSPAEQERAAQPTCAQGACSQHSRLDAPPAVTVTPAAAALALLCAPPAELHVTLDELAFDKLALEPPGTPTFSETSDGSLKRLGGRLSARLGESLRRVGDGLKEKLEKLESKLSVS